MSLAEAVQAELRERGADAAAALCEARVREAPQDADAYRHLAQIRAAGGEHGWALQAGMRACELAPHDPRAWSDLGRVYAHAAKLEEAARCFAEALDADVRHADAWHNLGLALERLHKPEAAFTALKNALLADPARAETWLALGDLLAEAAQFEDAARCYEHAARHDPSLAQASTRLADRMLARGKVERAEALFRRALAIDPAHVEGWLGLGRALEDKGAAAGACDAYLHALRLQPGHALGLGNFLSLAGHGDAPPETAGLAERATAALAREATGDEAKALVGYGLARFHDRRGEYAQAAAAASAANAARQRSAGVLDRAELAARVDSVIATYDADFFAAQRRFGLGSDQPVLIVGLPRSGTTLIEQILSAHPLLHGAGELPDLARIATAIDGERPWRAAAQLDARRSRALAVAYLRALRAGAPRRRLRCIDKAPLNFFQLALAALLFPNARVIHCRRSARDTALSIWMENFNHEQRYSTDLESLAFFTAQYERLMAHWREALPLRVLEVRYEDTVAGLERQARGILEFLGAPWDARCLDFHRNARAVQTPSRWQVREPLYVRSVGRWKHYAGHLPALLQAFPDTGPA